MIAEQGEDALHWRAMQKAINYAIRAIRTMIALLKN